MQTMRTLADNMAWMLVKIHAGDNPDYPQHENEWQKMNLLDKRHRKLAGISYDENPKLRIGVS